MSLEDTIESLGNLDPDKIGSWPLVIRAFIWLVVLCLGGYAVYHFKLSDSLILLEQKKQEEVELMKVFESKAFEAANLEQLKAQMVEMEVTFGTLVRQLPSKTEVPGLLEDITQLGVDSGLEFSSIGLNKERVVEFYAELPIEIIVRGGYHALGSFISGMASLPRIVTLHDFSMEPIEDNPSLLNMSIIAKTYRYNDGSGE